MSCDELRGGMDASQYKDYVLVLLFVKYVSDKYAGKSNALIVVPEEGSFADMAAQSGKADIGDQINKIIGRLAEANHLKGVIDQADFNDDTKLGKGKEMVDRLSRLVAIFNSPELDFGKNRAEGDDLLGDAYEYLMRHFATESGKSKGQFYTPAEVSRIIAKVVGVNKDTRQDQTIYDPTCGSGSLLLKAADEAPRGMSIYGQEKDNATAGLAKMNMFLHDQPGAEIFAANTLTSPHYKNKDGSLRTFDFVVANPPFSDKAWTNGMNPEADEFGRFEYGVPPAKNGDYAFLLHILKSMNSTGKGAVILPHGVLFRGNSEANIRRNLVRRGLIKGIIGLPTNLFYGTGIPACIIVLDKEHAQARKGIFIVDASKGFVKDGNKNRLRHQDIRKIVDVFNQQIEVERYSCMVNLAEIEANDFNLNIPRYIDSTEPEDLQDIEAHLKGGIPNRDVDALGRFWQVCPTLKRALFGEDRPGYSRLAIEPAHINDAICANEEFAKFTSSLHERFEHWRTNTIPRLKSLKHGDNPKALIDTLANEILVAFSNIPLIDKYDMYQHLLSFWTDTMQDDAYMIVGDGWLEASKLRQLKDKSKEEADLVIGKNEYRADLLPPRLIVARYFPSEQENILTLEAEVTAAEQAMEGMKEEHGDEEGLLSEVIDEKGKITKGAVNGRLKVIKDDREADDERKALKDYLALMEKETKAKSRVKEARAKLETKVANKYHQLTEEEVKAMVVEDKWINFLLASVQGELDRISLALSCRVKELALRYEVPLPQITDEVANLEAKVSVHLQRMGFSW
jgi:type I restriction enzyme M protein